MYEHRCINGAEFIRRIKKLGKERGVAVRFDARHGKGSHGRLYYGERFTTLKDPKKEIGLGLLKAMLQQLGLRAYPNNPHRADLDFSTDSSAKEARRWRDTGWP
ncbi:MAG: type II toxin-antitoxin system HicA family toxin, partial [Gammaproteobacteria bacterium]